MPDLELLLDLQNWTCLGVRRSRSFERAGNVRRGVLGAARYNHGLPNEERLARVEGQGRTAGTMKRLLTPLAVLWLSSLDSLPAAQQPAPPARTDIVLADFEVGV